MRGLMLRLIVWLYQMLQGFQKPMLVKTHSVKHSLLDVEQCAGCGMLDDPHIMEDIEGEAYCSSCLW